MGRRLIRIATAVAALAVVGTAAGAAPKVTLTITVSGQGSVTSQPAGIHCKPSCTLHGHKGEVVSLTATPSGSGTFSHWAPTCGTSTTCTVKLTGSRVIHAFFEAAPASPPPPPAPPAQPGTYAGTYTDGTYINFVVQGTSVGSFQFDNNGECPDGSTISGNLSADGPFTIQSDGSFSGTSSYALSNANVTVTISGTFAKNGTASGNLKADVVFTSGGADCTSTGTWTAKVQS